MSAGGPRRGRVKRGICKRPEDWQRSSFRHYATGCSTQATTGLEWATKHEAVILSEAKDPGAAGRLSGSVEAFVLRRIRASGECLETFSKLLALQGSFASLRGCDFFGIYPAGLSSRPEPERIATPHFRIIRGHP